jgi:transcriptional regulator with XRE-family HTH domain
VIGDELRKARQAAGLSQEKLGFLAQVSRNYISMVELNQNSPTLDTLIRMCHALDVRAGTLVARVEREMKRPSSPPTRRATRR